MDLEGETALLSIEFAAEGVAQIKIIKRLLAGDIVVFSEPHTILLAPDSDVDAVLKDNHAHLSEMGVTIPGVGLRCASFPPLSDDDVDALKSLVARLAKKGPSNRKAANIRDVPANPRLAQAGARTQALR